MPTNSGPGRSALMNPVANEAKSVQVGVAAIANKGAAPTTPAIQLREFLDKPWDMREYRSVPGTVSQPLSQPITVSTATGGAGGAGGSGGVLGSIALTLKSVATNQPNSDVVTIPGQNLGADAKLVSGGDSATAPKPVQVVQPNGSTTTDKNIYNDGGPNSGGDKGDAKNVGENVKNDNAGETKKKGDDADGKNDGATANENKQPEPPKGPTQAEVTKRLADEAQAADYKRLEEIANSLHNLQIVKDNTGFFHDPFRTIRQLIQDKIDKLHGEEDDVKARIDARKAAARAAADKAAADKAAADKAKESGTAK